MHDDLNFVMIEGEATPAFEEHLYKPFKLVCRFTVRSARYVYSPEDGRFTIRREELRCICFGSIATLALDMLGGGGRIRVTGSLQQQSWIGGDGQPQQDMVIVASNLEVLGEGLKDGA